MPTYNEKSECKITPIHCVPSEAYANIEDAAEGIPLDDLIAVYESLDDIVRSNNEHVEKLKRSLEKMTSKEECEGIKNEDDLKKWNKKMRKTLIFFSRYHYYSLNPIKLPSPQVPGPSDGDSLLRRAAKRLIKWLKS